MISLPPGLKIGYPPKRSVVARVATEIRLERTGLSLLVGRNGHGKSTLLKYLCGCLSMKPPGKLRTVYLPEELDFLPDTTAAALGYALLSGNGNARARFTADAQRVELSLDTPWGALSKGNKQKVRALLALTQAGETDAHLVCLDELFSGLDFVGRRLFWSMIEDMAKERHVLLSLHPETIRVRPDNTIGVANGVIWRFESGFSDWEAIEEELQHPPTAQPAPVGTGIPSPSPALRGGFQWLPIGMKPIFRLALLDWLHAKTWVALLALFVLGAIFAPFFAPTHIDPSLAAPARGQALYAILFLIICLYVPGLAAELGRAEVRNNHRLFWRAQGIGDAWCYLALLGALLVVVTLFVVVAGVAIRLGGSPELSTASLAQALTLTLLSSLVAVPLALGLSQRLAATAASLTAILVNIVGFYGPAVLDFARENERLTPSGRKTLETISSLTPHLRLGDQAERVTFAWDAIPAGWFAATAGYLAVCAIVAGGVGYALFRGRE